MWGFLTKEESLNEGFISSNDYDLLYEKYGKDYLDRHPGLYGLCYLVIKNFMKRYYSKEQIEFLSGEVYKTEKSSMEIACVLRKIYQEQNTILHSEELGLFIDLFEIKDENLINLWKKMATFHDQVIKASREN